MTKRPQPLATKLDTRLLGRGWPWLRVGLLAYFVTVPAVSLGQIGKTELEVRESESKEPVVCRLQLLDPKGKPVRIRGAEHVQGWNVVDGNMLFTGRAGSYTYRVFHGPRFSKASGGFTLERGTNSLSVVEIPKHCDLEAEGWYGGDLLAELSAAKTHPWLAAEDLEMAVSVQARPFEFSNKTSESGAWVEANSYHDTRPGSGLILHHWTPPAVVPAELPSARLLVMAKEVDGSGHNSVHNEVQRLWARDVPVWLASGKIDSIQILSNHLAPEGIPASAFKPFLDPDPGRFSGGRGPGRLVEYLYWQVLEAGLRIPPSAGSGFGKGTSPLGYNRVYAKVASMTESSWWQTVAAGRTFVTSGPLLRATVNGFAPGKVFRVPAGATQEIDVSLTLTVSDPVDYLDVIYNGKTIYQAALDEYAKQGGRIPPLSLDRSGWFLVRVVTGVGETYRIATTAPYYVEVGHQPRITRSSVALFTQWLDLAEQEISGMGDSAQTAAAPFLKAARAFWSERMEQATDD